MLIRSQFMLFFGGGGIGTYKFAVATKRASIFHSAADA
jgi:hypothetical protein